MQGKVEAVEERKGNSGNVFYSVTIGGVKGSSFDKNFPSLVGKTVEYESEVNGKYTNYKLIKEVSGNAPAQQQKQAPVNTSMEKPITGAQFKLLFIPEALKCACLSKPATGDISSVQIMQVADKYLDWMIKKALE